MVQAELERRARPRARVIARAHRVEQEVLPGLLKMAGDEEIDAWRSVLTALLAPWAYRPEVRAHVTASLKHPSPLVRNAAVRAAQSLPDAPALLAPLEKDPTRLVRLDAAWARLGQPGQKDSPVYREVLEYLATTCDQPTGAMRQAQLALAEQRGAEAESWARKAVSWDPSAGAQHILGRILHARGKLEEAAHALREAGRLEPTNAEHPYTLALLCGELGRSGDALEALQRTVGIDPQFGRACTTSASPGPRPASSATPSMRCAKPSPCSPTAPIPPTPARRSTCASARSTTPAPPRKRR